MSSWSDHDFWPPGGSGSATGAREDALHPPQHPQGAARTELALEHRPARIAAANGQVDPVAPGRLQREVWVRGLALHGLRAAVVDAQVPGRCVLEAPLDDGRARAVHLILVRRARDD